MTQQKPVELGQSVWVHCVEKYTLQPVNISRKTEWIVTDVNKSSFYASPKDKPSMIRRFNRRTWKHDTGIGSYYKASQEGSNTDAKRD